MIELKKSLTIIGSLIPVLLFLFQIIKTLINNKKFKKFAKQVADNLSVYDIVKNLDYKKLANLIFEKFIEKQIELDSKKVEDKK